MKLCQNWIMVKTLITAEEEKKAVYAYIIKRVAYKVREARVALGLGQKQVIEIGYTRRTIQRIESGKHDLTLIDILKASYTFDIQYQYLVNVPNSVLKKIKNKKNLIEEDYLL